jgi:hypothetical protein
MLLGAIAGANLVLILLDMTRAGFADDRVDAVSAADTRSVEVKRESSIGAGMR